MNMHIATSPQGNLYGYIGERWFQVTQKHPAYTELVEAIDADDPDKFIEIYDRETVDFNNKMHTIKEGIEITEDSVQYRGQTITDPIVVAVIKSYGTKCDALKLFVDNLFLNPSWSSVEQLGSFLKHGNFPLTADGCFLGYKAVRSDWRDFHSGTNMNVIGATISMDREDVTYDPNIACASGLHVGTYEYASGFGSSDSRIIIVKVNPAHCVSVPYDYNNQKLRCSQYTVLGECNDLLPMDTVYSADGHAFAAAHWFADVRNEELGRNRRPSVPTLSEKDLYRPPEEEEVDEDWDYDDDDYDDEDDDYDEDESDWYDYDDDDDDEVCPNCGELLEDCDCDETCPVCDEYLEDCTCDTTCRFCEELLADCTCIKDKPDLWCTKCEKKHYYKADHNYCPTCGTALVVYPAGDSKHV